MTDHFATALETAGKIHRGETTSQAVTEAMLARIADLDKTLKSFVTVTSDLALSAARQADEEISAGKILSPLHGVPIAVKDLLDTAGIQTTYGMKIYYGNVPEQDAGVVHKLKEAGCIILGKLKLTEGAYARHHPDIEVPVNPWNKDCWTGVSSSGSGVATAAGLCFGAIGSDTGGSIRFPSAANGLVGLKPTWSRVSRAGVFPLGYTLDHMGPMTRSVKDAAAMLGIIAGRDENDPTSSHLPVDDYLAAAIGDIKGLKIGVDWQYCTESVDPELAAAIKNAVSVLEGLGVEIQEVNIPFTEVTAGWPITCGVEAAHAHKDTYPARAAEYGAIKELLDFGRAIPAENYLQQELNRRAFKESLKAVFERVDLVICPSMADAAAPREGSPEAEAVEQDLLRTMRFTAPFDYSGSPTLSIPWQVGSKGIPLSIQLVARDFAEAQLVNAGYALEKAGGHFGNHPAL